MRLRHVLSSLFVLLASPTVWAAPDCSNHTAPQMLSASAIALPPLSRELPTSTHMLGMPDDLLGYVGNDDQAVDTVLARLREQACHSAVTGSSATGAAGYVPRTKWDNTPYRFSAGGDGKKFTAADFDAWMKARGIHISKGPPQPASAGAPTPATTTPEAPPQK